MRLVKRPDILVACLVCFVLGSLWGQRESKVVVADPLLPKTAAIPFSMESRLGSNVYLQTAAEYRACCLQIYKSAEFRLETILDMARPKLLKPAVVMDL